jgi:hypothetical protein
VGRCDGGFQGKAWHSLEVAGRESAWFVGIFCLLFAIFLMFDPFLDIQSFLQSFLFDFMGEKAGIPAQSMRPKRHESLMVSRHGQKG